MTRSNVLVPGGEDGYLVHLFDATGRRDIAICTTALTGERNVTKPA